MRCSLAPIAVRGPLGLDVVPSAIALAGAEVELAPSTRGSGASRRLIGEIADRYDTIFIDCPPSLGLLTVNALTAADAVLIPLQCEYYALEGLTQLLATINLVRDHLNPDLELEGVLLTMYDGRTNLSAEVAAEVRRHLGASVFDTVDPAERPALGSAEPRPADRALPARFDRARSPTARWPTSSGAAPTRTAGHRATCRSRRLRRIADRTRLTRSSGWWRRDRQARTPARASVAASRR